MRVSVGLVVNAAASRDVRRLTSLARTVDVHERVNVVARVLRGLAAAGVDDAFYMVEPCHVVERAWALLAGTPASTGRAPSLRPVCGGLPAIDAAATARAAEALRDADVPCVISVGGDGTHRAVARGWPDAVLVPHAGGTNNAFAAGADPSVVGLAAGVFAADPARWAHHIRPSSKLDVVQDGGRSTSALVDVAVVDEAWVGSHAVWDPLLLREAVLARSDPTVSGLAGVGGMLHPIVSDASGLHIRFGAGGTSVLAPLGPGQLHVVPVASWAVLASGDEVVVGGGEHVALAFDGEREVVLHRGERARVCLVDGGPGVLDVAGLAWAGAEQGVFLRSGGSEMSDEGRRDAYR